MTSFHSSKALIATRHVYTYVSAAKNILCAIFVTRMEQRMFQPLESTSWKSSRSVKGVTPKYVQITKN